MTLNVCDHEGWVVDSRPLPTDPIDHDAGLLPNMGCTNLRCGLCGAKVRSIGGFVASSNLGDVAALYEIADLSSSPHLTASPSMRTYLCRCEYHVEGNEHRLDDKEGVQVGTQWTCVGHPIATLPHTFDGLNVTADNLEQIVAENMAGVIPAGARAPDRNDGVWTARLCTRLEKTPHADRIASAVATYLTHADLATRVRALFFFSYVPAYAAAMRADVLLAKHAELFVGVPNPHSNARATKTLEYVLWRTAGSQLPANAALRDVAHAFALDPQRSSKPLFITLAHNDATWFGNNAARLAAANPAQKQALLDAASAGQLPSAVFDAIRNAT